MGASSGDGLLEGCTAPAGREVLEVREGVGVREVFATRLVLGVRGTLVFAKSGSS
jgi:hypothetical protein